MTAVIDASVVLKWFLEEEEVEPAMGLLVSHLEGHLDFVAPELLLYEVSNILIRSKQFTVPDMQQGIAKLYDLKFEFVEPSARLIQETMPLAKERGLSFYDAYYVQVAKTLDLQLITADRKLKNKVADLPFVTLLA